MINGLKAQLPAGWKELIRDQLRHTVVVVRANGFDTFGKPVDGERVRVPCFIDGSRARVKTAEGDEIQVSWTVEFAPNTEVNINDRLENGRDRAGRELLPIGRIVNIVEVTHPSVGNLTSTAQVARA